jgi:hypothetical protein
LVIGQNEEKDWNMDMQDGQDAGNGRMDFENIPQRESAEPPNDQ